MKFPLLRALLFLTPTIASADPAGICLHAYGPDAPAAKVECFEFERIEKIQSGTRFFLSKGSSVVISNYRNRGIISYPKTPSLPEQEISELLQTYEQHAKQIPSTRRFLNPRILELRNRMAETVKQAEQMAKLPTLTLSDGTQLLGCRATKRDDSMVTVMHAAGIKRIQLSELSEADKVALKVDELPIVKTETSEIAVDDDSPQDAPAGEAAPASGETGSPMQPESASDSRPQSSVNIANGSSFLKLAQQIEQSSQKAIGELTERGDKIGKTAEELKVEFDKLGGEAALEELQNDAGKYSVIQVGGLLTGAGFQDLATGNQNVYEVVFRGRGYSSIVVTGKNLPFGARTVLYLKKSETITATLKNGISTTVNVFVEAPPLRNEDSPQIVKVFDDLQKQLAEVNDIAESIKKVEERTTKAVSGLNAAARLSGSLKTPKLVVSPGLAREGFSASIQDRKLVEVLEAIKAGSLSNLNNALTPSSRNGFGADFSTLDQFDPHGTRDIPDADNVQRLFSSLANQRFRVELVTLDRNKVIENQNRQRHAFQGRSYVTIPLPQEKLKEMGARAGGGHSANFAERQRCDVDEVMNDEILANKTGYMKEIPVFSCSMIVFCLSDRKGPHGEEEITLHSECEALALLRDQQTKGAQQQFDAGRIDKKQLEGMTKKAQDQYLGKLNSLLTKY